MQANELTKKISEMSFNQVAEIAALMANDTRDEAAFVLEAALNVLEATMDEQDFVRFCDKLCA